jgi:hypothetical protein
MSSCRLSRKHVSPKNVPCELPRVFRVGGALVNKIANNGNRAGVRQNVFDTIESGDKLRACQDWQNGLDRIGYKYRKPLAGGAELL